MVSAFRSLGSYGGCRLSTWLYRIARRRIADHFRSPQRRQLPFGLLHEPTATGGPGCPISDAKAGNSDLRDAIALLGEPCRSIFLAFYFGEVPVREIALELQMPENTVKSHLRRGRALLRKQLGGPR